MPDGRVRFLNEKEGYGFIERDIGADVFVHVRNVDGDLDEGVAVTFDIESSERGPRAENVVVRGDEQT